MVVGGGGRTPFVATLVALVLAGALGCGSEDEPASPERRHPLTAVVHRLQDRFDAKDVEGVCALMARDAQIQAGEVAHSTPTTCARDVRRVFRLIDGGGGWLDGDKPRVTAVRAGDRTATVTLTFDDWVGDVPFVKEAGSWKLAGFFGMARKGFERLERDTPDRPFPPPGRPVAIAAASGERCTPMSDARYPRISGGCVVRVSAKSVPVEMMTPFGPFKFGDCSVDYRVYVDGDGRTWTDEWEVEGSSESGCSDINPCIRQRTQYEVDRLPWKGRIRGDGEDGFRHHMDMCLRTCIGLFAGEFVLELSPGDAAAGWRAERADAGATGFRFNDELEVKGDPLEIAAASPSG